MALNTTETTALPDGNSSPERILAEYVVGTSFDHWPAGITDQMRRLVLDSLGCAFGAYSTLPIGKVLLDYVHELGGREESTVVGGSKVSCPLAAAVNAQMAGVTLEFDETGPGGHAGSGIAFTALSVGERMGSSGKDVINAMALGYELNSRFAAARDRSQPAKRIDHAVINSAVVAAKLLGLDVTRVNHAMALAGLVKPIDSAAIFYSMAEHYPMVHGGNLWHTRLGIEAALLANNGFLARTDFLEAFPDHNLEILMRPSAQEMFEMHIKPWNSSRLTHGGIEGALKIVGENDLNVEDIDEITFRGMRAYLDLPFNNPSPTDMTTANHSVQWAFAMALRGYDAGPDWYAAERFSDAAALALARKVRIEELPEATKNWKEQPPGTYGSAHPNEVEVKAKGEVYRERIETFLGSPERPMPQELFEAKFRRQAVRAVGEKANDIIDLVNALDDLSDVRRLTELFN